MSSNAPTFDPLNASDDQIKGMMRGYLAAGIAPSQAACPEDASIAFAHGWRMRRNDKLGVADDDQRELARRFMAQQGQA